MLTTPIKWCTACKTNHDVSAFGKDRSRGDGLRTVCVASRKKPRKTVEDRFFAKTRKDRSGCLLWTGSTYPSGYGSFWFAGRVDGAHRVAWIIAHGPIPDGLWVLHRCDIRPCVNRDHLFLGDRNENVADMDRKGRRVTLRGESNPRSKLTAAQVAEIRALRGTSSQREIAQQYGVSKALIRGILNGRIWRYDATATIPAVAR